MCFGCQMVFSLPSIPFYLDRLQTNKFACRGYKDEKIYITKRKVFIILPPFRKKLKSLFATKQLSLGFY